MPYAPSFKGLPEFYYGLDSQMMHTYRESVLTVNKDMVMQAANEYLLDAMATERTSRVIFGGEEIDKKLFRSEGWKVQSPVEYAKIRS